MKWLIVSVSVFCAGSAWACPRTMDRELGVILTRTDPFFSVLLRDTDVGLTESRIMLRGSEPETVSSLYPHPLIIGQRNSGNSSLSLEYSSNVDELDRLAGTGSWQSEVVLKSDSKVLGEGVSKVKFLGTSSVDVGRCHYDVWRVEDRLELEGRAPIIFEKWYSPSLGIVLRSIKLAANGEAIDMVAFDRISVGETY